MDPRFPMQQIRVGLITGYQPHSLIFLLHRHFPCVRDWSKIVIYSINGTFLARDFPYGSRPTQKLPISGILSKIWNLIHQQPYGRENRRKHSFLSLEP
ncbi:hypothetical protein [Paracandidimonas soli]|uniref:hypothetical protein n=1 Tax=Paracandidimonas soli TaxID=1917182 RepID=UPI0010509035|nr:hypothetical protein [Paracandidimonas soli]